MGKLSKCPHCGLESSRAYAGGHDCTAQPMKAKDKDMGRTIAKKLKCGCTFDLSGDCISACIEHFNGLGVTI